MGLRATDVILIPIDRARRAELEGLIARSWQCDFRELWVSEVAMLKGWASWMFLLVFSSFERLNRVFHVGFLFHCIGNKQGYSYMCLDSDLDEI